MARLLKMITIVLSLTTLSILNSCATPSISLTVQAAKELNLNDALQSLPVMLRVYQLSNRLAFQRASFYELWQQDSAALKETLLSRKEIYVAPNKSTHVNIICVKDVKYIGIVALFRKPKFRRWKIIKKITKNSVFLPLHITLYLQNNSIMMTQ